ncbi:MAG TPA: response regulator transcription factor [Acidimicrobiia bacterium]|nr:response regulator transcription factor [Acidimicrobiia bacterium]
MATAEHKPRILIVEDDRTIATALRIGLRDAGYAVSVAGDGREFDALVTRVRPDLALLDVSLPEGPNGFDLACQFRSLSDAPIVFITAFDSLDDRLASFDVGADDYLPKPFALAELLARLRAVLRRSGRLVSPVIEVRDILVDEQQRVVTKGGTVVHLTGTEFDLLWTLAHAPGRVFSKTQLLSLVWGFDQYAPNLVEVHVSSLRRKLDQGPVRLIHTERGRGYVLRP